MQPHHLSRYQKSKKGRPVTCVYLLLALFHEQTLFLGEISVPDIAEIELDLLCVQRSAVDFLPALDGVSFDVCCTFGGQKRV